MKRHYLFPAAHRARTREPRPVRRGNLDMIYQPEERDLLVMLKDTDQNGITLGGIIVVAASAELGITREAITTAMTKFAKHGLFTTRLVGENLRYYITKRGKQEAGTI